MSVSLACLPTLLALCTAAPAPVGGAAKPLPLVVLDAGHGGEATGARGICGVWEKEVALAVALKAAALLRATGRCRVLLTRETGATLGLDARVKMANAAQGNVFVSIHANASPNPEALGIETFFLSRQGSSARLDRLLERENEGLRRPGKQRSSSLGVVLSGLSLDALEAKSQRLAIELQKSLADGLGTRGRGVLQAPFVVLMGSKMPAALVEVGFLTHAEQCLHLVDAGGQARAAEALVAGLLSFLDELA